MKWEELSERGVKNRVVQERERVRCKRWVRVMGEVQVVGWDLGKRVGCRGERKGKLRVWWERKTRRIRE